MNYNTNGSFDVGLWQINHVNWAGCNGGSAPSPPMTVLSAPPKSTKEAETPGEPGAPIPPADADKSLQMICMNINLKQLKKTENIFICKPIEFECIFMKGL